MKRKIIIALMMITFTLLLAGCAGYNTATTPEQQITYDLSSEPAVLDPAVVNNNSGKQLLNMLCEGLVRMKPDGTYEKAMAENWDIDHDGMKYTFTIREARWSNGDEVTARDFEYAWMRVLDPAVHNPYAYLLYNIKNAQGYHRSLDAEYEGKKKGLEEVGIKVLNDRTLVIELEKQDPAMIAKLIHPVFLPLPQKSVEDLQEVFFTAENIVGNGPFVVTGFEQGKGYELAKNMSYWDRDTVILEKITVLTAVGTEKTDIWGMYNRKLLDLTVNVPTERIPNGLRRGSLFTAPLCANYFYEFNTTETPFNDLRVRKAFSYSIDRATLAEQFLQGGQNPAQGLVPQGMTSFFPGGDYPGQGENMVPDNNPEEARKLLAEAGYPGGKGFPRVKLVIDNKESHLYLAAYLQSEWEKQLGIQMEIIPLNWQDRSQKMKDGDFDMVLLGWVADYADAAAFLDRYVISPGNNDTGWSNQDFDESMRTAGSTLDEKVRLEKLHQAEMLLLSELPVLPLYDYTRICAVHAWVKGCFFPPVGPEVELKWAFVE